MTNEEAKKKHCPINSHPLSDGMCCADKCMLWVDYDNGNGHCAKVALLGMLDQISDDIRH